MPICRSAPGVTAKAISRPALVRDVANRVDVARAMNATKAARADAAAGEGADAADATAKRVQRGPKELAGQKALGVRKGPPGLKDAFAPKDLSERRGQTELCHQTELDDPPEPVGLWRADGPPALIGHHNSSWTTKWTSSTIVCHPVDLRRRRPLDHSAAAHLLGGWRTKRSNMTTWEATKRKLAATQRTKRFPPGTKP